MAPDTRMRRGWFYLALLILAGALAAFYRPSARTADIDAPLTMPQFRNMELAGAEWAVKRSAEQWGNVSFRNSRIYRHEARVSVCGEVQLNGADYQRYVVSGGNVLLEYSADEFEQAWNAICV